MIETIRQGLQAEDVIVPITKLCRWFDVPRRTVYYKLVKAAPKVDPKFSVPIKSLIEEAPSFGYRTVAYLLGFNKNTVQRLFQLMGWQVRKRPVGFRPRIQALPSVAMRPNERWSTDLCRVWAGRDGWTTLALVIDCHTRELLGWHLSRSGRACAAGAALEHALIARFGTLGRVPEPFLLCSNSQEGDQLLILSRYRSLLFLVYFISLQILYKRVRRKSNSLFSATRTRRSLYRIMSFIDPIPPYIANNLADMILGFSSNSALIFSRAAAQSLSAPALSSSTIFFKITPTSSCVVILMDST